MNCPMLQLMSPVASSLVQLLPPLVLEGFPISSKRVGSKSPAGGALWVGGFMGRVGIQAV